jgi:hypothetical protein
MAFLLVNFFEIITSATINESEILFVFNSNTIQHSVRAFLFFVGITWIFLQVR